MATPTKTTIYQQGFQVCDIVNKSEQLTLAGADTIAAGTLLARKVVADAVTVTPDAGNTGDGTVTAAVAAGSVVPLVGNYNLECIEAVADGGIFKLEDPNGAIVSPYIETTGAAQDVAGLTLTISDGAADFIVGDKFELAVAADGKMVLFATDGAGGAQVPTAILSTELVVTGAGDSSVRVTISGEVIKERLIIDADGDDSNIDNVVIKQLRDVDILAISYEQLAEGDN